MPGPGLSPLEAARLKTRLLTDGLVLADALRADLSHGIRPPLRVRSGSCGGLDIVLPGGFYVNCPIFEDFARRSTYRLEQSDAGGVTLRNAGGEEHQIRLLPFPRYYCQNNSQGRPLSQIGQLCGDRLGIGITNACTYWGQAERRCKFCSIGLNISVERPNKTTDEILEVVEAAFSDPVAPARHILLGGGTPAGADAGAFAIARVAQAIRPRWRQPIYAMIAAPSDPGAIDALAEAGVDELGMNVEFYDSSTAQRIIPGKHRELGLAHYLKMLEHAVSVFGPLNTRSIMVVGLEPLEATVAGVEALASRGVMPILSPFRPLAGTDLGELPTPSFDLLWDILLASSEAADRHNVPLGPLCIPCQGNTLTIPDHEAYCFY